LTTPQQPTHVASVQQLLTPSPVDNAQWRGFAASAAAPESEGAGDGDKKSQGGAGDVRQKLEEAGGKGDLSRVFDIVEQQGENFEDADVEFALAQVVRAAEAQGWDEQAVVDNVHNSPTFQLLVDMVAAGAERQPVQSLTLVVQTFGRLRYESQIVLDLMASKLITELDAMGPEQLVQLAEGLGKLDHSPGVQLLDSVCDRMAALSKEGHVSDEHKSKLSKWLRELGHSCDTHAGTPPQQQQPDRAQQGADYQA
jgi:hypothetical protein